MNRQEVERKIVDMMVQTFELEPEAVTLQARLYDDLELDSIDALDMVVKLQELMPHRVKEEEMRGLRTVGDVVELVMRANAGTGAAKPPVPAEQAG